MTLVWCLVYILIHERELLHCFYQKPQPCRAGPAGGNDTPPAWLRFPYKALSLTTLIPSMQRMFTNHPVKIFHSFWPHRHTNSTYLVSSLAPKLFCLLLCRIYAWWRTYLASKSRIGNTFHTVEHLFLRLLIAVNRKLLRLKKLFQTYFWPPFISGWTFLPKCF